MLIACFVIIVTFLCFSNPQILIRPSLPASSSFLNSISADSHSKFLKVKWESYFKQSTTFESGKKCTPLRGSNGPYLFLSPRVASSPVNS